MAYRGPTWVSKDDLAKFETRRFDEEMQKIERPSEPLRRTIELNDFDTSMKDIPLPSQEYQRQQEVSAFDDAMGKVDLPSQQYSHLLEPEPPQSGFGFQTPPEASPSASVADQPPAVASSPAAGGADDPVAKTLQYLGVVKNQPTMDTAGELAKFDAMMGEQGITPGAEDKSVIGQDQAQQDDQQPPTTPDIPGLPFAGPGIPAFLPNKATQIPEETRRKMLAGEPLDAQDFIGSAANAAQNQNSSSPAAVEGAPFTKLGTSEEDLARGFARGVTDGAGLLGDVRSAAEVAAQNAGRELPSLYPVAKEAASVAGDAVEQAPSRRFYHGTGSAFDTPDPARFGPGALGKVYYLSDSPEVASGFADVGRRLGGDTHPNVRAVDLPADLRLFTTDRPLTADGARELARQGYDGVERFDPRFNHTEVGIFPGSLSKIHNAISGTEGGQIDPRYALGLGALGAAGAAVAGGIGNLAQGAGDAIGNAAQTVGGAIGNAAQSFKDRYDAVPDPLEGDAGAAAMYRKTQQNPSPLTDAVVQTLKPGLDYIGGSIKQANEDRAKANDAAALVMAKAARHEPITDEEWAAAFDPAAGMAMGLTNPGQSVAPPPETKRAVLSQLWNRARNVIEAQGPAGQELGQALHAWRETAEQSVGEWVSQMPTVRKLSKAEFDNFVDVAEGKGSALNARVSQAVKEWDGVRKDVYQRAVDAGLDIGQVADYFPHTYEPGTFSGKGWASAIKHLVDSGQAKTELEAAQILRQVTSRRNRPYGNLEMERVADLPGYRRTKEALFGYLDSAANRISQVETFGQGDENALKLINKIADQGYDADAAKSLFDIAVNAAKYGTYQSKISGVLRGFNTVTKLGLGALTNVGQNVNTATVVGIRRTLANIPEALFSSAAKEDALRAGVTVDGVINAMREGTGVVGGILGKVTAPGFNQVETFNRTLAYQAGVDFAEDLAQRAAKGSDWAKKSLGKLGLDANDVAARGTLTDAERQTAGRAIVERTQFKVDPQDLPGWASSPFGRVVAQFRSFSYNQSAFMGREIIGPALKGDVAPLARFLVAGGLAGMTLKEVRNAITGREPEQDTTKRIIGYYQQVGGLGLASDVVSGLLPQNAQKLDRDRAVSMALGTLGGPTIGDIAEGYGSLAMLAAKHDPVPLGRWALRHIPVAGPTVQNYVLPYGNSDEKQGLPAFKGSTTGFKGSSVGWRH